MSSSSSSCSNNSPIPSKCDCGLDVKILTSKSKDNPGRPFFRCVSQKENHLFKWVEDAVYEEVRINMPKVAAMEREIGANKSEIEVLKAVIDDMKKELNMKTKWLLIVLFCLIVVVVVVIVRFLVGGKIKVHSAF